jgi:hypothetical protein
VLWLGSAKNSTKRLNWLQNARSAQRAIAMMGANHHPIGAWVTPKPIASGVAEKDIFSKTGNGAAGAKPGSSNKRFRSWLRTI